MHLLTRCIPTMHGCYCGGSEVGCCSGISVVQTMVCGGCCSGISVVQTMVCGGCCSGISVV